MLALMFGSLWLIPDNEPEVKTGAEFEREAVADSGSDIKDHTDYNDYKVEAWVAAQNIVERYLKSPSTADYGWQSYEECVTESVNGYMVEGWVDSQNSFGATLRTDFSMKLQRASSGNWKTVGPPTFNQR